MCVSNDLTYKFKLNKNIEAVFNFVIIIFESVRQDKTNHNSSIAHIKLHFQFFKHLIIMSMLTNGQHKKKEISKNSKNKK